ncbi:hypothetical protein D3C76_1412030 [compost metagenome]
MLLSRGIAIDKDSHYFLIWAGKIEITVDLYVGSFVPYINLLGMKIYSFNCPFEMTARLRPARSFISRHIVVVP